MDLSLPDLGTVADQIQQAITSAEMSWTMDMASQITVDIHDPELEMFRANHFQLRRPLLHGTSRFEIAAVQTAQGVGSAGLISLEARPAGVQAMKRDKDPGAYASSTPTEFARAVAAKHGLRFHGQTNAPQGTSFVAVDPASTAIESAWTALQRAATSAQFSLFEADGDLYFASQEWLMGKWANVPVHWPPRPSDPFQLLELPDARRSDDAAYEAEVSAVLARPNATRLRAGMTVWFAGIGEFDTAYLITEVKYKLDSPDPVTIQARKPVQILPLPNLPATPPTTTPPTPTPGETPSGPGVYTVEQMLQLASRRFSGELLRVMVAIAAAESGWKTDAVSSTSDYGLWQINLPVWGSTLNVSGADLFNPDINLEAAYEVYTRQGLTAWVTYDQGLHLKYLASVNAAAAALGL